MKFGIGGAQPIENRRDFAGGAAFGFARNRPALDLQRAQVRVAAQLAPAFDQRGMERGGADHRVSAPALQFVVERFEPAEHTPHPHDRVAAVGGAAAVRGPPLGLDHHPLEALVRDRHGQAGRLGHHAAVGTPARDERVGANALVLFVDDRGDDQPAGGQTARFDHHARSVDHRRDTALHVLRAAAVDTTVAFDRIEWPRHACHADRVDMTAQHQRSSGRATVEHANDIRPARRHLLYFGREANPSIFRHQRPRDGRLPRRAGHQRRVDGIDGDEIFEEANDWIRR